MLQTLMIVLPVFALMAIGFVALRSGAVGEFTDRGLADFVFVIVIPVLIFRAIVDARLPDAMPWGYLVACYGALFAIWIAGYFVACQGFGRSANEGVVLGFAAAQANGVFIGMPLALRAYGDAANAPLVIFIATHVPVMMVVGAVMLERSGRSGNFAVLARSLARNPLILATVLGSLWRVFDLELPTLLRQVVDALAAAAIPSALVSMGMALSRYGLVRDFGLVSVIALLKLVLQPLIALLIARHVFALDAVWTATAVIIAAAPTGINAYLFATRYGAGEGTTAGAVTLTTALSVASTAFWLWLLASP